MDPALYHTSSPFRREIVASFLALFMAGLSAGSAHSETTLTPATPDAAAAPATPEVDTAGLINSMDALNDDRKLSIGDRISYRVIEEQKDPVSLTITDSGELAVPLLGLFPAAGKTCKQLAEQLKPLLEKDYFYKATVIVGLDTQSTRSPGKIYIMGQVHSQGAVDLPANEKVTISQAILANGGFADFADERRVRLTRKKPDGTTETMRIDIKDILDKGHTEKDVVLQPGDTIRVPEKLINF
jgi:protein involved in polysaccharide export with SLBB domain